MAYYIVGLYESQNRETKKLWGYMALWRLCAGPFPSKAQALAAERRGDARPKLRFHNRKWLLMQTYVVGRNALLTYGLSDEHPHAMQGVFDTAEGA